MKFSNGAVSGFFAAFLAASIGSGNVEAAEGSWWSKFMQDKSEVNSSAIKSWNPEVDDEQLSAAMSSIGGSMFKALKTIQEEARSMKGSLGAAGSEIKASLRKTASLIETGIDEARKEMAPLLKNAKNYLQNTQKDMALLLPAKEIVQGMAHMIRLIKAKQQINIADVQVHRFVLRLIKMILVLSSVFCFYVVISTGPLIWSMLLAPLSIFSLSNISSSSIAQEINFQEAEAREAELIIKRTAETGMPVDKSAGEEISKFLSSISDSELEKMAEESGVLWKTDITAQEFPGRFREAVKSWFGLDAK